MPNFLIHPLPEPDTAELPDEREFQHLVAAGLPAEDFAPGFFEEELGRLAQRLTEDQGIPPALGADLAGSVTPWNELAADSPDPLAEDLAGISEQIDARMFEFDHYLANVPREPPPPDPIVDVEPILDDLAGDVATLAALPPPEPPPPPPPAASGTIVVTAGNIVVWATSGASDARVFVSVDGGEPTLFAEGASGAQEAPWIIPGHAYTFSLVDFSLGVEGALLALTVKDLVVPPSPLLPEITVIGPGGIAPPTITQFAPTPPPASLIVPGPPAPPVAVSIAARELLREQGGPFNPANVYDIRNGQVVEVGIAYAIRDPNTGEMVSGLTAERVFNPTTKQFETTIPPTFPANPPQSAFLQEQLANIAAAGGGPSSGE